MSCAVNRSPWNDGDVFAVTAEANREASAASAMLSRAGRASTESRGIGVTLELKNEGKTEHSFTVDLQGIDKDIEPGDEGEVTVSIPKSGVISFYCKYHKSSGMAGALAVEGGTGGMTGTGTTTNESGKGGY